MKLFSRQAFCAVLFFVCAALFARAPELVKVKSPSMGVEVSNIVVLPDSYPDGAAEYPVIYLLHGYGGDHRMWTAMRPDLPEVASEKNVIFVMPDGGTSWYWDSPKNPALKYETYVAGELVPFVDSKYKTVKSPKGRAIAGLSMGGHGALWLAINHPDVFGAAGSMSGGVDIRPFPNNWDMAKSLGDYASNPEIWDSHTVIEALSKIRPGSPAIIIDCGTSDLFYRVNEKLHEKLLYMNIPHDYITRPGAHNGDYWKNAVDYQIMFFDKFFRK